MRFITVSLLLFLVIWLVGYLTIWRYIIKPKLVDKPVVPPVPPVPPAQPAIPVTPAIPAQPLTPPTLPKN